MEEYEDDVEKKDEPEIELLFGSDTPNNRPI